MHVILFNFLEAEEFNVQDSYNMLINCLSWRKDYFGHVDILEQQFPEFEQLENVTTYIHGFDRQGHPVYYNDYSTLNNYQHLNRKILGTDESMHKFNKWRLQVLERGIRMHPGRINSVVLAYDFRYEKTDELMAADALFCSILDNYPGMVSYQIWINNPWYVHAYLWIQRLLYIDPEYSECVFAKPGQVFETLCKYIKPEYIPIQYGGLLDGGELNSHHVSEITVIGEEKFDKGIDEEQTTAKSDVRGMLNILQRLSLTLSQVWQSLWWRRQGRCMKVTEQAGESASRKTKVV